MLIQMSALPVVFSYSGFWWSRLKTQETTKGNYQHLHDFSSTWCLLIGDSFMARRPLMVKWVILPVDVVEYFVPETET